MPDQNESQSDKRQSWWNTLPGVLTALAALVTAVAALVGAWHYQNSHAAPTNTADNTINATPPNQHDGAMQPFQPGTQPTEPTHPIQPSTPPPPKTYHASALSLLRHDPGPNETQMATFREVGPAKINYYDNQAPAAGLEVYVNGDHSKFSLLPGDNKPLTFGPIKVTVKLVSQSTSEAVVDVDVTEPQ